MTVKFSRTKPSPRYERLLRQYQIMHREGEAHLGIPHAELPEGELDGVVCTDVLEHCPEEDMEWIVAELFGHARRFVFANVACFPAQKRLPSGQNAHCTVRPVKWWRALIENAARRRPRVLYEFRMTYDDRTPDGPRRVEGVLTNEEGWRAASQT
ncbi:MAG: class I SAM-dependent methyltransferase [Burkholderiales bacterium]